MFLLGSVVSEVETRLNEYDWGSEATVEGSRLLYDGTHLDEYIWRVLPDAIRLVQGAGGEPTRMGPKDFKVVDGDKAGDGLWNMEGGDGRPLVIVRSVDIDKGGVWSVLVELPADCLRFVAVKLAGWGKEVRELSEPDGVAWQMQFNPYVGGSRHEPIVAEVYSPRGVRALDCRPSYVSQLDKRYPLLGGRYNLSGAGSGELSYLVVVREPRVVGADGAVPGGLNSLGSHRGDDLRVDMADWLRPAVVWMCASLVSTIFERSALADRLASIAWGLARRDVGVKEES